MTPVYKNAAIAEFVRLRVVASAPAPPNGTFIVGFLPAKWTIDKFLGFMFDTRHPDLGWTSTRELTGMTYTDRRYILAR